MGGAAAFPEQAASMSFFSSVNERIERLGVPIPKGLHKFLGVGLVGLAIHFTVFSLIDKFDTPNLTSGLRGVIGDGWLFHMISAMNTQHSFAWLISLTIATAVTWTLNRKFTFVSTGRKLHHEAFRYAVVTIVSQTVAFLVFHGLVELAKWLPPQVDLLVGAAAATVISYAGQRLFTFAPRKADKAETAPK
jgi:putative flippase GtrA